MDYDRTNNITPFQQPIASRGVVDHEVPLEDESELFGHLELLPVFT